jgi:hypothetical protein
MAGINTAADDFFVSSLSILWGPTSRSVQSTYLKGNLCYNNPEVISMSAKVDQILQDVKGLNSSELRELLRKMADSIELHGWLQLAEQSFSDWDNPQDEVYDQL